MDNLIMRVMDMLLAFPSLSWPWSLWRSFVPPS
jgi:ABC-type dipeptide/oligopeptide/nickel transport system permease subunit